MIFCTHTGKSKIGKTDHTSIGEGVEQLVLSSIAGEKVNGTVTSEKSLAVS